MSSRRFHIVHIATDPLTAFTLMEGQLADLKRRGFDVSVITAPGPLLDAVQQREQVRALGLPMRRDPAPSADVLSLFRLVRLLRRLKPDLVMAGTPKAGLLGVIAARLARVPVVVYLLRGLRFEGARGSKRLVLIATEHIAGSLSHRVFANSQSLRQKFVELGCASAQKTWVPGAGTSNGVDVERFRPTEQSRLWASSERARLGIPGAAIVIGFVGRFVRDKGLIELLEAFRIAAAQVPELWLLLIGDFDATDPVPEPTRRELEQHARIRLTGFVREPAPYYGLMDIFGFPSLREGFPNAPLEAAAAGLPAVAFAATGTVDAIVHGETGYLAPLQDIRGFADGLVAYAVDPELRRRVGRAAQERVARLFSRETVWQNLVDEYVRLLSAAGLASDQE
ncbi:MAG TPA: glycosyltransferase family 4 protein [Polyangiaceae bacterium]|nr:glycosyltransferase family 4 protein [Polyangiaceae bacterium]